MIRRLVLVMTLGIVITMLIGCQPNDEVIKIGFVGTLSGAGSDVAIAGRRGAKLAIEEINQSGGIGDRPLELLAKDDQNQEAVARQNLYDFVEEDIQVVIGHFTSNMMLSVIEEVNQREILYVSPTASSDSLANKDDHMIRFISSTKDQATSLVDVAKQNSDKKFMVIFDEKNKAYTQNLSDNFMLELDNIDGTVIGSLSYSELDDKVLNGIDQSINDQKPDGVFIIANASEFAKIAQELYRKNHQVSLYGALWSRSNDLLAYGGEAVEGSYLVSGIDYAYLSDKFQKVGHMYEERYGESMSFHAMYTYEAVMAVADAMRLKESVDYQSVLDGIIEISEFEGLQTTYSINEFGDNSRGYIVEKIVKGQFKRVE